MSDETKNDGQQNEEPRTESPAASAMPAADTAQQRITELEVQAAQLKDQLLRKASEFDNYSAGQRMISQHWHVLRQRIR